MCSIEEGIGTTLKGRFFEGVFLRNSASVTA
jgi:hypothetical protein